MNFVKQAKALYVISALLILLTGLILFIFPAASAELICYAGGGLLIFCGIARIIGYFSGDPYRLAFQFDLALGILFCALGVFLILHPLAAVSALSVAAGLYMLLEGVFKLQTAVDAKRFGLTKWWVILAGALICILMGVLLVLHPFRGGSTMLMLIGLSLAINGIQHLFNALYTVRPRKSP